jgi:phosphate transport system permease protein
VSGPARQLWRSGEPFIWLTGGALVLTLLLVLGLIGLILSSGLGFFWTQDVVRLTLTDGTVVSGQLVEREAIPAKAGQYRIKLKVANRDLYGADFQWVDEAAISGRSYPPDIVVMERTEWGLLIGTIKEVREAGRVVAVGPQQGLAELERRLPDAARARREIKKIEKGEVGAINHAQEKIRLGLRRLALQGETSGPAVESLQRETAALQARYQEQEARLAGLRGRQTASVVISADGGKEKALPLIQVLHVEAPNAMSLPAKGVRYLARVWEFVSDDPRESNTEGGVFPAIFGTVMMVLIMSVMVTPLGVLAAFYLREYARQGTFVSAVRIAVNNLAGVPSIVFGVFGVGFFIYFVGGTIDRLFFSEALPSPTFGTGGILWAPLTLAPPHGARRDRRDRRRTGGDPAGHARGLPGAGRDQARDDAAGGPARRDALDSDRAHPRHGPRGGRGGAAHDHRGGEAAPALPIDGFWPFVHLDRKFMHLGFHIYDVGFQSPNVDAARPMVSSRRCLLVIVVLLNLFAIRLRNRLRRTYAMSAV